MEKQSSWEQCGKTFKQKFVFGSIQELLLGIAIYVNIVRKQHKKPSSQKACSKGSQHDQKTWVIVLTSNCRQTVGI